jgi:hypothetical protein
VKKPTACRSIYYGEASATSSIFLYLRHHFIPMAILLDLPTELLELIIRFLGSIDDVHGFGGSYRNIYNVIY